MMSTPSSSAVATVRRIAAYSACCGWICKPIRTGRVVTFCTLPEQRQPQLGIAGLTDLDGDSPVLPRQVAGRLLAGLIAAGGLRDDVQHARAGARSSVRVNSIDSPEPASS